VTAGLATSLADALLQVVGGTAIATDAFKVVAAQPHSGDPGSNGTANSVSGNFSPGRFESLTWGSPVTDGSVRKVPMSNGTPPEITCTSTATVNHLSFWSANSAGTFRGSASTAEKVPNANDKLRLASLSFSLTPIAA
jgi:hypothetical protein